MATVSNAYNDNVLYDWVSDASDVHEDEIFYEEADSNTAGAALGAGSDSEEDLIEFDGTAPDTEYFLDSSALEHLSYEEDEETEGELEHYFSSLATISTFDFSLVHVPHSKGPLSSEPETVSQGFDHILETAPRTSLLSSESDTETLQVMSDSIHHAQDGNTLLGVPLDTPQFAEFTAICGSEMDCLTNELPDLDMMFGSKMQGDVSSMFSSSANERSDASSEEDLSSHDEHKPASVCLKTLHSSKTKLASQVDVVGNSPSKLQAAAKKARASKTLHSKCLESQNKVNNITPTTVGPTSKQRKRKRNAIGSPAVFPQDTVFSSDDSDEDQTFQSRPKRRRLSKQKHHTELSSFTLPNLVRKKYLIALNDPRFMPQLYDPQLRSNFFAHEQVLRVIETENDSDVEII